MTTFDRHIIRRLLTSFILLMGLLIVFFVVLHYVEYVDEFMDHGASNREIFLEYYPSYIPEIIKLVSPIALFLSTIYLTGKLAQELQLMALSAGGVSLYRMLLPYLAVGIAVTGIMFWFNGWVVPIANQQRLAFEAQYLGNTQTPVDNTDIYRRNAPGSVLSISYYNQTEQTAYNVSLLAFDSGEHLRERIDSESMQWMDSLQTWRLSDVSTRVFLADDAIRRSHVASLDTTLNIYPRDLARAAHNVDRLTVPQAANFIASLRRSSAQHMGRPLVAFYRKFAYPLANLILVLVGVPLAAVRKRGGQAMQIGLGFVTAFLYLAFIELIEPFGYTQTISPLLAAWLPHIVFLLVGLILLLYVRK